MLDHLYLRVSNYAASKQFYTTLLATLGSKPCMEFPQTQLLGFARKPLTETADQIKFFITAASGATPQPIHVGFAADTAEEVDAFYAAALAAGAKDNGAPGIRSHFHPLYYCCYVVDPDGHNVEAVCHTGVGERQAG